MPHPLAFDDSRDHKQSRDKFEEYKEKDKLNRENLDRDKKVTVRVYSPNKSFDSSDGVIGSQSSDVYSQSIQSVDQPPMNSTNPVTDVAPISDIVQDKAGWLQNWVEDSRIVYCGPVDQTIKYSSDLLKASQCTGTHRQNNISFREKLNKAKLKTKKIRERVEKGQHENKQLE